MKAQATIVALSAFLIFNSTFSSCKKENDKQASCKLVKVTQKNGNNTAVINITYNNEEKIATIGTASPLGNSSKLFTYTGNNINIVTTTSSGSRRDSVTLNANGRPSNIRSFGDMSGMSWTNQAFEYNGTQLVKVLHSDNSSSTPSTSVATYNNGNMVSLVTGALVSVLEYYTDKNNQVGDYLEFAHTMTYGVSIYPNKNLVKSIGSGNEQTQFVYDFDADGKITKAIISAGNNSTVLTYEYQCN